MVSSCRNLSKIYKLRKKSLYKLGEKKGLIINEDYCIDHKILNCFNIDANCRKSLLLKIMFLLLNAFLSGQHFFH